MKVALSETNKKIYREPTVENEVKNQINDLEHEEEKK